jgi:mono/diheme cytochrome c family protein
VRRMPQAVPRSPAVGQGTRGRGDSSPAATRGAGLRPAPPLACLLVASITWLGPAAAQEAPDAAAVERGAYVFNAAGGCSCHTDVKNQGEHLAGGRALTTPFGTFFSPNITPDPETGIGRWSKDDFVHAMREGEAPDGSPYFPAFPYSAFTKMSDTDLGDLWAFLAAQPAVAKPNREHEIDPPFGWRFLMRFWRTLYFEAGPFRPDPARSETENRGAYLAEAMAHCGECHTPRDMLGGLERDLWLAGSADGAEGDATPNITPDKETGIGSWSDDAIERTLATGMLPDGDFVGGAMAEAVEGFRHLTPADLGAIVAYLRSVPPVRNQIGKPAPAASEDSGSAWD